jgi:MFS superfamily sulfate permease-like transporter
MVKPVQIMQVWKSSRLHAALMVYTAITVIFFGFLPGVLSATFLYAVLARVLDRPAVAHEQLEAEPGAAADTAARSPEQG